MQHRYGFVAFVVAGSLTLAACGSASTIESQAAEAVVDAPIKVEVSSTVLEADAEPASRVDLSNVPGIDLGLRPTTSGPDFAFESIAAKPTVIWFWGPG